MAFREINLNELDEYYKQIQKYSTEYNECLEELINTIRMTAVYWRGEEGDTFRDKIYTLVGSSFDGVSKEMNVEMEYIKRLKVVLESAQEQIKNRINS